LFARRLHWERADCTLRAPQTWELPGDARGGPENAAAALAAAAVEAHAAGTPAPRVVVCGGDGTASWVLAALHAVWPTDVPPPAFAVLPLGTGNDLARVTGWADCRIARDALAAEASPSDVLELLRVVEAAVATPLDWWRLTVESAAADTTPSGVSAAVPAGADAAASAAPAARELFWTNYVSVGFDAGVALAFDGARRAAPSLFASRAGNKAAYGLLGARDFALGACADLPEHLTLHADGRRVALPEGARGVLLLNISSFMGGARPWPDEPAPGGADGGLNTNAAPYDGALEVAAHYGALHLAAINLGLAAAVPLAVAREVLVSTSAPLPMQADGEAWAQPGPAVLRVSWQGSVSVLHAPALE
jgi:diacylglycerol kinase (ATP)